jgi:hypothetical protein
MAKRRSKQDVGADTAQQVDVEIILLRRFVEKLEPSLSQAAVEAFTDLLEQWVQEIWRRNMELCADDILSIKDSATSLHRRLTGLTSESIKAGSHTRTEIGAASYDRQDGQNGLYSILNFVLQDGASPTDLRDYLMPFPGSSRKWNNYNPRSARQIGPLESAAIQLWICSSAISAIGVRLIYLNASTPM